MSSDFFQQSFLHNSLQSWLLSATIALAVMLLLKLIQNLLLKRLRSGTGGQAGAIAETLGNQTRLLFIFIAGLYAGVQALALSESLQQLITSVFIISLLVQAGFWGEALLSAVISRKKQQLSEGDPASASTFTLLHLAIRVGLWSALVLVALDTLGIDITTFVAGLGIGGIAVALALQNILGDLFASLSILLDKPFAVGDFLLIGEHMGNVENIGLKSTRLRSLSGEQLVFSNADLLTSRIRNYGRMFERRVVLTFDIVYQTPRAQMQKIPTLIRQAIESHSDVRFDRAHFKQFGSYSLIFETVFFVLSPDYNLFMDLQQSILFSVHEKFAREKIEFAYPTQTIYSQGN